MNLITTSKLAKKAPRMGQGLYYDPLYGYIPVRNELRQIIDSEVFQRLRGIKQLSTLYLVYVGANHTRFEHSIGVSYLAGIVHDRLIESLGNSPKNGILKGVQLNEITRIVAQLTGLLHDIGHGPFAHVFEMYCKRVKTTDVWNHEKWGRRLITGKDENGNIITSNPLFQQIPDYLRKLKKYFSKDYSGHPTLDLLDPENIANLCFDLPPKLKTDEHSNRYFFLRDIVTSPFGVDRLDYLRRDAFYTGVKTGDIDIWEIIRNLQLNEYIDAEDGKNKIHLFINPSAAISIEALFSSRDIVYRKIYHNAISRSAQELIIRGLMVLEKDPENIAFLSDNDLLNLFRTSNNEFAKEVEERMRYRLLYELHPICTFEEIHHDLKELEFIESDIKRADFYLKEQKIGENANIENDRLIFYDIESVPAIKRSDLEWPMFYDKIQQKALNIFDLQPNLRTIYDGELIKGLSKIENYKNQVSKVYVCFPLEHIDLSLNNLVENDPSSEKDVDTEIEKIYTEKLESLIIDFFCNILGWERDKINSNKAKKQLIESNKKRLISYLKDIYWIKKHIWLK